MIRLTRVYTGLIALVILAFLVTGCGGRATPTATLVEWEGKLLLEATVQQWRLAPDENRLATAIYSTFRLVDEDDHNLPILREYIADESVDLVYLDPLFNSNWSYNVLFKDESGKAAEAQITAFDDTWHVGTWDCRGMNGGGKSWPLANLSRRHSCPYVRTHTIAIHMRDSHGPPCIPQRRRGCTGMNGSGESLPTTQRYTAIHAPPVKRS